MWKALGGIAVCCAAVFGFVIYASATSTFKLKMMRAPDANVVVDSSTGAARLVKPEKIVTADPQGVPKAVAVTSVHDFGRMNPDEKGRHSFEIRNAGTGALTVKVKQTSCKCTVGGVENGVVGPGESTQVVLEWNTGRTLVDYEQTATIATNDPDAKELDLRVKGLVRKDIGSVAEELDCDVIEPGKPVVIQTVLYSQLWNDFEITELTSDLPDVKWEVTPLVGEEGPKLDATCRQQLRVTISGKLPQGGFQDRLRMKVKPLDPPGVETTFDLPIKGKTLRRLAVYGNALDVDTGIDLGYVQQGVGKKVRLLMKVRDEQLDLNVKEVKFEPAFLKCEVTPHMEKGEAKAGLYDLVVELPADAPEGQYRGSPEGKVNVVIEHPRIESLELPIRFSVIP